MITEKNIFVGVVEEKFEYICILRKHLVAGTERESLDQQNQLENARSHYFWPDTSSLILCDNTRLIVGTILFKCSAAYIIVKKRTIPAHSFIFPSYIQLTGCDVIYIYGSQGIHKPIG